MKKFNVFVIILLTFFVGIYKVNASISSQCMYEDDKGNLYRITLNAVGNPIEYINSSFEELNEDGSFSKNASFDVYATSPKFKSIMTSGYCPQEYIVYEFDSSLNANTHHKFVLPKEDTTWSVDEKTNTINVKYNEYNNTYNPKGSFKKYSLKKTDKTSYGCEAKASSGQLACCYKNGTIEFQVNVYNSGVNNSSKIVTKMNIKSAGRTNVSASQIITTFDESGKAFTKGCPSAVNAIETISRGTKYYYLYFDSDYKTNSNYNTKLSELQNSNGKQSTYTSSYSLTASDGALKSNNSSNNQNNSNSGTSLSTVSSCTTSKNTTGMVCCYSYKKSDSEKYYIQISTRIKGTTSTWNGADISYAKVSGGTDYFLSTSSVQDSAFKSNCPSTIYGYAERGGGQTNYSFHLYTNKSTRDTASSSAHTAAQTSRGEVLKTTDFTLIDPQTGNNNSNNNSNNQGNNTDPGYTDPGYTDPDSGSLSCCYKRENSLLKLTISGDDIYTEVSGESMIIAQKNFDSSDFSGGCVSSIGGFRSTRLGNEYRYYLYSHSFNNDQTYLDESNASRNANGGFKYETFMGTNAYMSTACDNNTYWNEPSSPTQNNHNKPDYQNNHGEVNLSDDKNYASLATTELVYCGSNIVKEAETDEYGYTTYTYEGLSIHKIPSRIVRIVNIIINVLYIGAIIILIVLGMIDFAKGVVGQKEDEIQKGKKIFVKRLIAAFIIFLVIFIVKMVIRFVNDSTSNANLVDCMDCFISGRCHEETNK